MFLDDLLTCYAGGMNKSSFDAIIIGGGLAGASVAYALAKRGGTVCIIEQGAALGTKASGNRFGLVTPYIASVESDTERLYRAGYEFTLELLRSESAFMQLFYPSGALQFPTTSRLKAALAGESQLLGASDIKRLSAKEVDGISGISISKPAFFVPSAGYLPPRELIKTAIGLHPEKIYTNLNSAAIEISRCSALDWSVILSSGSRLSAPNIIVCGAYEAQKIDALAWLPLEPIRGQTVSIQATPQSQSLRTVLSFGGYLTPEITGSHFLGAHYRHNDMNEHPEDTDTSEITTRCAQWLPALDFQQSSTLDARVCFRTSTLDRLPYIGAVPDFLQMRDEASSYQPGSDLFSKVPLRNLSGIFVNLGHGSRGLVSAPIGGEIIARLIHNQSLAELDIAAEITSPSRLVYKLLARN